jgi:hypothetical protein
MSVSLLDQYHEFVAPKTVAKIWNITRIRYLEFRKSELEANLVVSSKLEPSETGSTIYQKVSNDASNVVQIHLTEYALNQEIMFQSVIVLENAVC